MPFNDDSTWVTGNPMQQGGTGDTMALAIEHYTGRMFEQMARLQALKPYVRFDKLTGTNVLSTRAFGKTSIAKREEAGTVLPNTAEPKVGRNHLMVETLLYSRHNLDVWMQAVTDYPYLDKLATADGTEWAKLYDQACIIQAGKAARMTTSAHTGVTLADGHGGGNTVAFASVASSKDGNLIVGKLRELIVKFQNRDIDPTSGGWLLLCRPEYLWAMSEAEQIINTDYLTSSGQVLTGTPIIRMFSIPVVATMNMPDTNITSHLLNTTENGNAFNVDFSNMPFVLVHGDALIAAEVLSLQTRQHFSEERLCDVITSFSSFSVGVDNPRLAGAMLVSA